MALPRAQAAAVLISVAGIGISIYLTALHFAGVVPACPASGAINCEAVLSSPYAMLAGSSIPTSALGIGWFAVSAAVWTRPPGSVHLAWSALGLVAVLGLVFVEIVLLGVICLWCTGAHALVLALMVIALATRT